MAELTGRQGIFRAARAAACIRSPKTSGSTAATASSARRRRSRPASPSPTAIATTAPYAPATWAMAPPYQGQVAEAFNLAAAWALPVVFVIENNVVSSYTHIQANTSRECLAQRGAPFGIPGCQVDGMDVEAVVQAMQVAAAHARVGYAALHPGNADLPLPRALYVRSRQVCGHGRAGRAAARADRSAAHRPGAITGSGAGLGGRI